MKAHGTERIVLFAVVCVLTTGYASGTSARELTQGAYENARGPMGIVPVGVNWARAWGCCGFENVQLRSLAFDRMPVRKAGEETPRI
jgi:hypothetical protein